MAIPTTLTCFGVMVPFIMIEFDANIGAISWVPGIAVAVLNLLGILPLAHDLYVLLFLY